MKELPKESADHLQEFGSLLKKSLALQIIALILSLGAGYIPIESLFITTLVLMRITSIGVTIFQIFMGIRLYHMKNSYEEMNLMFAFFFFTCMVAFSLLYNVLSITGAFIDNNFLAFANNLSSTATISFELLFWMFFLQFLKATQIYLLDALMKHVKILIGVIITALTINFVFYFSILEVFLGWILLLAILIVGILRFMYQLKIVNGIIDNFEWNQ